MAATNINQGKKAEAIKDYDTAVDPLQARAQSRSDRTSNTSSSVDRMRFEAGAGPREQGKRFSHKGDLQMALAEFQKAAMIDPSSPIAQQETQRRWTPSRRNNAAAQRLPPAPPEDEPK